MYLILVLTMFVLAVAVVDHSYLRSEVMHPIGIRDYIGLAWLSASMGALAGAFGSNFDLTDSVREATYSQRFHERRELFDSYQERRAQE